MAASRQFELPAPDFERFSRLVRQASGIYFSKNKAEVLRSALAQRAGIVGASDLGKYYDFVNSIRGGGELVRLLEHLSVQETQFFRNRPHFEALRKYIIPELARSKEDERRLRFWCAGCSTGEEPYSVAMTVLDILPDPGSWSIRILGTDLNEVALRRAARGWYPEQKLACVDRQHLRRYFEPEKDGYRLGDDVRRLIRFRRHNLVKDPLPVESLGGCDAVFCRNVIIYFTHDTAKFVIERFFDVINPGGYLFLGHSETLWKMSTMYSLVEIGDAFIYRKPSPGQGSRRFIPDRRLRRAGLPPGVEHDRRLAGRDRRRDSQAGRPEPERQEQPQERRQEDEPAPPSSQKVKEKARQYISRGEFGKAVSLINQALAPAAADAETYFLLGLAHEKANEPEAAREDFRRALFLDANLSLAYFHLASVLEQAGELKSAIREYRNAGRSFEKNPPGAWETELEAFDARSLVNLCRRKIETLKQSA